MGYAWARRDSTTLTGRNRRSAFYTTPGQSQTCYDPRTEDDMLEPEKTENLRIGEALARLRQRRDLTPTQIARRMGKDPSNITRWERGETPLLADELWRYLRALEASFADLDQQLEPQVPNFRLRKIAGKLDAMG